MSATTITQGAPSLAPGARGSGITAREREILAWSARGKTSHEIAIITGLTKRTVDFHLDAARMKLNAVTRIQAVALAVFHQLVQL